MTGPAVGTAAVCALGTAAVGAVGDAAVGAVGDAAVGAVGDAATVARVADGALASVDPAHLVGAGGVLGALARTWVADRLDVAAFPVGTLAVNVLGSFALGVVTALGPGRSATLLVGTGFCGAFTTFSSFAVETVRLYETGERARAAGNAALTLVGAGLGIALAWGLVAAATALAAG